MPGEKLITIINEDEFDGTRDGIEAFVFNLIGRLYPTSSINVSQDNEYFANKWMSPDYRERISHAISELLYMGEKVIIFSDGDEAWTDFSKYTSEKRICLEEKFSKLKMDVKDKLISSFDFNTRQADKYVRNIILMTPCWNIESWAYFNVEKLNEIGEYYKIKDLTNSITRLKKSDFEENKVSKIGANLTIGNESRKDLFNEELLSESYPYDELEKVGKSFKHFYTELKDLIR
ncbi:hypothetical protein DAY19_02045 [Halobacteriovorax vibrionivorans]|uniref:Uncharacterized protein n=1 Tax=Halobacteriovorax vibrionivorans TaxID=2152716 RepID=A0ABY0IL26_9BACT|nr:MULTISPECIES: hypothetical protein [Halobacteriovorax]RZF22576.1 hypothetical protein DAY19_02045 [Halobacteriovorax vibrionivorans]TGD47769.1 hypothetical protein EP118_07410 [Halobacteriovorax sp. Y22]